MSDVPLHDSLVREGNVWVFGDRLDIETISSHKFMFNKEGRARECMAAADPRFGAEVRPGDILVAGRLFGFGLGHEHANLALKETGIGGIVARSFAPQFFRLSIDHGLLVAQCDEILRVAVAGSPLRVDFASGAITNPTTGAVAVGHVPRGPAADIVAAGGLVPFITSRLAGNQTGLGHG